MRGLLEVHTVFPQLEDSICGITSATANIMNSSIPATKRLETAQYVAYRIDALGDRCSTPISWSSVKLLLLVGVSWAIHAAQIVVFTFTRTLVATDIGMGTNALIILGAGVSLGSLFGSPFFGYLADARGRRTALLLAMTLSLVGMGLSAFVRTDIELIAARVVAGVGLGGEVPAATVLIQELSPRSKRGSMVALLEVFWGMGGVIGVALSFGAAPQIGWRSMYLAFCGCAIYIGILRFAVPESPRWLACAGKCDEAIAVVERLERAHGLHNSDAQLDTETLMVETALISRTAFDPQHDCSKTVLNKASHTRTVGLWTLWTAVTMSSYALGIYVPTLISLTGFNVFASWETIVLMQMCQVPGSVAAALLIQRQGPTRTLVLFATLVFVTAVTISYLPWSKPVVIVGTSLVSLFLGGCWSCVLAYTPEKYSTEVCGRGVGYTFGFSRIGAIGGSYLYPHMFGVWLMSVPSITWVFGGLLAAVMFGIVMLFEEDVKE